MRQKIKTLIVEYGTVALVVYLAISLTVFLGFWAGIRLGYKTASTTGAWGTAGAAYVLMRLTLPLRIAATMAATPFIAKLFERITGRRRAARPPNTI